VAAALSKQAVRDLSPLWGVTATVDAFTSLRTVPVGYWPVIIVDQVGGGALGYHQDQHGRPYALVQYSDSWSLTASHETVEMLVDPFGSRTAAGRSPKSGQGQVEFLVEACDPCEDPQFAYTIDGVLASDFITPRFYDPRKTTSARYSFTGAITQPRQIRQGGYLSWWDPQSDHVWQELWLGSAKQYKDLGHGEFGRGQSLREFVDRHTDVPKVAEGLPGDDEVLTDARDAWTAAQASADARGAQLEEEVSRWLS
jgi:hypothetical protein